MKLASIAFEDKDDGFSFAMVEMGECFGGDCKNGGGVCHIRR